MTRTNDRSSMIRAAAVGAGSGVVASLVMALYAMVAAWIRGTGFFTPLYHIASVWASQSAMMASMKEAMAGNDFDLALGTGLLGAVIHMMTGAMYGALFGLAVARLRVSAGIVTGLGLVYGAIVFPISAFIGLPIAAALFNSGDQITNMAQMAGWGTFVVEHLLYGLSLGLLAARSRSHAVLMPAPAQ